MGLYNAIKTVANHRRAILTVSFHLQSQLKPNSIPCSPKYTRSLIDKLEALNVAVSKLLEE